VTTPHRYYKTAQWKRIREEQLRKHPMCQCPHCMGHGLVANLVDHIEPHHGDMRRFFDKRNLQSMSKGCHDRYKQSQEKGGKGFNAGCDTRGQPLNGSHHWYDTPP